MTGGRVPCCLLARPPLIQTSIASLWPLATVHFLWELWSVPLAVCREYAVLPCGFGMRCPTFSGMCVPSSHSFAFLTRLLLISRELRSHQLSVSTFFLPYLTLLFLTYRKDKRSIALLRILLGIVLLGDLVNRSFDLYAHYTDHGLMSRAVILLCFFSIFSTTKKLTECRKC